MKIRSLFIFLLFISIQLSAVNTVSYVSESVTMTLNPTADGGVFGGNRTANYGTVNSLYVKNGATAHRKTFIKFDLTSTALSNITSAKVRLYCSAMQGAAYSVTTYQQTNDTWTETGLTWANAPATGTAIQAVSVTAPGAYYEWDVSSFVQSQNLGDKIVSLVFDDADTNNLQMTFNSKEAASNLPQLVIVADASTEKVNQTITFPSLPAKVVGDTDFCACATTSSLLTVSYASSNTSVATIIGENIHIMGAGTSTITASQAGNTNYNAAPDVSQILTIYSNEFIITKKTVNESNGTSNTTNIISGVTKTEPLSQYGGSLNLYVGNASGYFKTYKTTDDVWYLVDPEGYLFLSMGICSVIPGGSRSLPNDIKAIGANTLGNWSDYANIKGMPYTVRVNVGGSFKNSTTRRKYLYDKSNILAVFDSDFASLIMTYMKTAITTDMKTDKWLLGYFSDNELKIANSFNNYLLDRFVNLDNYKGPAGEVDGVKYLGDQDPNYIGAVNWVEARHSGTFTVTADDRSVFNEVIAGKYYQACRAAFNVVDPNHLFIGSRMNTGLDNPYLYKSIGQYVDVISNNYYHRWSVNTSELDNWLNNSGKPFIITEFYAKGDDSGLVNTDGAGFTCPTQQDRADFFENFTMGLLKHKGNVGFHWFKYNDSAATNAGLVDANFNWYTTLKNSFFDITRDAYNLRNFLIYGTSNIYKLEAVSPTSASINVGATQQLTATVLPSNATNISVIWSSSDNSIATVSASGLVTGVAEGRATITVTTQDGEKTATSDIIVTLNTAINELYSKTQEQVVNIYPNPLNQDILTIKIDDNGVWGNIEVIITNLQGQTVYRNQRLENKTFDINTSGLLKSSIYLVSVRSGQSITNTKLIVNQR